MFGTYLEYCPCPFQPRSTQPTALSMRVVERELCRNRTLKIKVYQIHLRLVLHVSE